MLKKILFITLLVLLLVSLLIFRKEITNFYKEKRVLVEKRIEMEGKNGIETVAENLEIPWEIVFLPNNDFIVTERPGNLRIIGNKEKVYSIENVEDVGEGGLLGMALHPNFSENGWIYLYFTSKFDNRVERYFLDDSGLSGKNLIIGDIPKGVNHNGGRIAFGLDNFLYITTGDAGIPSLSQDISSLAGKILRVKDDGSLLEDNPFQNEVWSFGHRNPQGLAWDNLGRLWSTEHGPSGNDELNLIKKGGNYGWPIIQGDQTKSGMENPIVHSGLNTWAPSGMIYYKGSLFFTGLRGVALYKVEVLENISDMKVSSYFKNEFGRLRSVGLGPDNMIYLLTNNRDGRGIPINKDDRIIRFNYYFSDG